MKLISKASTKDAIRLFEILSAATTAGGIGYYPQDIINDWHAGRSAAGMREVLLSETFYNLLDEGEIKGYVHLGNAEIVGLFVDPKDHGRGYGRDLIHFAIKEIRDRPVKVLATLNAVDFYAKFGFEKVDMRVVRRHERDIYVWEMRLG